MFVRKITDAQINEAKKLHAGGLSVNKIAAKLGLSGNTIRKHLELTPNVPTNHKEQLLDWCYKKLNYWEKFVITNNKLSVKERLEIDSRCNKIVDTIRQLTGLKNEQVNENDKIEIIENHNTTEAEWDEIDASSVPKANKQCN